MKEEDDERVNEEVEERDAWMADPFALDVTLSTLNPSDAVTPPLIDTSEAPTSTLPPDTTLDAGVIVIDVREKLPALTTKRGHSSLGEEEMVNVMDVNKTLHPSCDATNTPLPSTPNTPLYTNPLPMMVSEVSEGRLTDSLSASCVPAERETESGVGYSPEADALCVSASDITVHGRSSHPHVECVDPFPFT